MKPIYHKFNNQYKFFRHKISCYLVRSISSRLLCRDNFVREHTDGIPVKQTPPLRCLFRFIIKVSLNLRVFLKFFDMNANGIADFSLF